jgi:acetylornithine/succinyldiaminopimelate/putrescine aminotransferase
VEKIMGKRDQSWGTICPATADTLGLVRAFNDEQRCTFLISSNYMHAETAKLGFVMHTVLAEQTQRAGDCRTFFVNSGLEALSGAIKLARQTSVRSKRSDQGRILLLDEQNRYRPFFDPLARGVEKSLTPHIWFAESLSEAKRLLDDHGWSAFVHVRYPDAALDSELAGLVEGARSLGAMIISVRSELDLDDAFLAKPSYAADVVVFGENMTEHQLPFGCFTMTERAHSVWNNDVDCFAQTSTFGGNQLCSAAALQALDRHGLISERHRAGFAEIASGPDRMVAYWGKHVNPGMAALASIFGMDLDVRRASGGRLKLWDGREVIDCSGGFGSNLRGHNPPDIVGLLERHDPGHDYFADLERLLLSLTKFAHAFPAVSGATAVDVAASLGMLANPSRGKVVTFIGNFSGKTLFSLNFSKHGPQLTESDQDAFRPYYSELIYVDPFAADAVEKLTGILKAGDVALVWFEMFRGGMCEELPMHILALIDDLKEEGGYLIGVDEVLSGGWRTGEHYLAHANVIRGSDIVTLGKTLSDMTIPMAAVLVTDDVYARARATNQHQVDRLKVHYRNALSAHISLNALSQVSGSEEKQKFLRAQREIELGLRNIAAKSRVFSGVRGRGTLLVLLMNHRYFPFHHRSKPGNLLEMAMSHLIFERCGVFVFLLRFLHRVATDENDARELIQRLARGIEGITPLMVYRYALSRILSQKLPGLAAVVAGRAARPSRGQLRPVGEASSAPDRALPRTP